MAEESYSGREVAMAIDAMRESIVALRDRIDSEINAKLDVVNEKFAGLRDEMNAKFTGLRDEMNAKFDGLCGQLTIIKWIMGGFGAVSVAAFAHLHLVTTDLKVAVGRIDEHLVSVDARLAGMDGRFQQMDRRFEQMDRWFEQMDRRFEALEQRIDTKFDMLTTLILNLQPPPRRTEGFTLAPGLGSRQ